MPALETYYGLDDVVFTASVAGPKKRIVHAIKVTKDGVAYGFEAPNSFFTMFSDGGHNWFPETEVYSNPEDAQAKSTELADEDRQKARAAKVEHIADLKEALEKEEAELAQGIVEINEDTEDLE